MKVENIDVNKAIDDAKQMLAKEVDLSPAFRTSIELVLMLVSLLVNQLGLNSQNSSKPPSSDPNRKKKLKNGSGRKPGGQKGRKGTNLEKFEDPDRIKEIKIDRRSLPKGIYTVDGYEARQVVDIDISRFVTEYRAQILVDGNGNRFIAEFPEKLTQVVQYGDTVKAHAVYLSQYQFLPYGRVQEHFLDQVRIGVSPGSIFNFNKLAYESLERFEGILKNKLINSYQLHADETGINIGGKRRWVHVVSNDKFTLYSPHEKRGKDAMDEIGVLPEFEGILSHDHWKPYYRYNFTHALCNAHHLRELERAEEQDGQEWAKNMKSLLLGINKAVEDAGGALNPKNSEQYRVKYRKILNHGEIECPPPPPCENGVKKKRGRTKRSKSRNLLERLINFEEDALRFMEDRSVPFTNNQGENDIRMVKIQQKISGSFRSMEGASIFCRIRSYLSTCRKNDVRASEALKLIFEGTLPTFLTEN